MKVNLEKKNKILSKKSACVSHWGWTFQLRLTCQSGILSQAKKEWTMINEKEIHFQYIGALQDQLADMKKAHRSVLKSLKKVLNINVPLLVCILTVHTETHRHTDTQTHRHTDTHTHTKRTHRHYHTCMLCTNVICRAFSQRKYLCFCSSFAAIHFGVIAL